MATGKQMLKLDVFAHNEPAQALYRKVDFVEEAQIVWWLPLPAEPVQGQTALQFHNWPVTLAMYQHHGFC